MKSLHPRWKNGSNNRTADQSFNLCFLNYVFYRGTISKEYSCALLITYISQVNDTKEQLRKWHNETCERLKIDIHTGKREQQGLERIITLIAQPYPPYTYLDEKLLRCIRTQQCADKITLNLEPDRYKEDVLIIAKGGKLYYLPESYQQISN